MHFDFTTRKETERAVFDGTMDRILATEDDLVPSSGFLSAVMAQVQDEAVAPPPIPFPWKRALPGILTAAGVFGWGGSVLVRQGLMLLTTPAPKNSIPFPVDSFAALIDSVNPADWVALALGIALFFWLLSHTFAERGGLF